MAKELGIKPGNFRSVDIVRKGEDDRCFAYDIQGDISNKKILIVEDDLPTGKGVVFAKKQFVKRGAEVKTAAVYVKPTTQQFADFYAETCEKLPDYPHKQFHDGERK